MVVAALAWLFHEPLRRWWATRIGDDTSDSSPERKDLAVDEPRDSHSVDSQREAVPVKLGNAPQLPSLVVGRDDALGDLKARLSARSTAHVQNLTAVRGLPGVGKTTLAAALAHDAAIARAFPEGVLWVSLGQTPDLLSALATWVRALGVDDLARPTTVQETSERLSGLLRHKRMLLIVDDVWKHEDALPFRVGGPACALLITTRNTDVADDIAPTSDQVYLLTVLSNEDALELLKTLAPAVVQRYLEPARELVRLLEGLPLALQVAGRLLQAEAQAGWGVSDLLRELLEDTARLLRETAPADMGDLTNQTTPTLTALLRKSTTVLDRETRDRFAYLGPFACKPATFDLDAMKAVWHTPDAKPTARILVARGLLEPVGLERYQMHSILVDHANSLPTE